MSKRVGLYVRVSTGEQSTELQRRELEQFVVARGWNLVRIYEDQATGTNANRPMLKALMKDVRQRNLDVVMCWKMDRLFRSLKDLLFTLHELSELKVEFIALRDQIDLTTATGKLMAQLLGAFAEFEASLIRARVSAGLANARAKGIKLGRPSTIDEAEVKRLRLQGLSLNQIADRIGKSKAGVYKTLVKLRLQTLDLIGSENDE